MFTLCDASIDPGSGYRATPWLSPAAVSMTTGCGVSINQLPPKKSPPTRTATSVFAQFDTALMGRWIEYRMGLSRR